MEDLWHFSLVTAGARHHKKVASKNSYRVIQGQQEGVWDWGNLW